MFVLLLGLRYLGLHGYLANGLMLMLLLLLLLLLINCIFSSYFHRNGAGWGAV